MQQASALLRAGPAPATPPDDDEGHVVGGAHVLTAADHYAYGYDELPIVAHTPIKRFAAQMLNLAMALARRTDDHAPDTAAAADGVWCGGV